MSRWSRAARSRLARSPVGDAWRWSRRRLRREPPPTAAVADDGPLRTAEPYPLDLSVFRVAPDPDRAAQILDGAFGHGYLVTTGTPPVLPGFLEQWSTTTVGALLVRAAPRTQVSTAGHGDAHVVLLGHPLDVDRGTADAGGIVGRLAQLLATDGHEATVRDAAYLAGRWTLLLLTGPGPGRPGRLTALPDTMGSQPVFYAGGPDGLALGSADTLVAIARRLPVDPAAQHLAAEIRRLRPTGVAYLPGQVSSYLGVQQVVPNCLLQVDPETPDQVRHTRFWPFIDRVEDDDLESVHEEFRDRLQGQLRLVAGLGRTAWSLTGGLDSRVLLAHLDVPPAPGTLAFTYLNPRDVARDPGAARDVFVANELADRLGIPHRVLRWRQAKAGSTFGRLHRATYPVTRVSHGAAHAMWADLPHDIWEIQGNGGEIGTVFRVNRPAGPLEPAKVATMWLGRAFERHPRVLSIFEDYLEHAQLEDERLRGYDHHDVFYWEHRMGRWGWTKFLDGDLSHRIVPPFNDRRLLEVMLRLPEQQRVSKALYARVLHGHPLLQVDD